MEKDLRKEKTGFKASLTVEMSIILPMVIFIIFLLIHTAFYYHDKAVITGAVSETVNKCVEAVRDNNENKINPEMLLRKRVNGRLIMLEVKDLNIDMSDKRIVAELKAAKWKFRTKIHMEAAVTYPEEKLRSKQKREEN